MARCPNCRAEMTAHDAERLYGRSLTIDICRGCEGIWFDGTELLQLAPAATLALLAEVVKEEGGARPPLAARLECPRCGSRLVEAHDRQRNTRFTYHRCPRTHGKFLTFFQFLRAKNFVRPLDEGEVARLRKAVRQVNCTNCGAPVDIERGATCAFCRAPLAILDPDQVRKAVAEIQHAIEDPASKREALPLAMAAERLHAERVFAEADRAESPAALDLLLDARDPIGGGLRLLRTLLLRT